MAYVRGFQGAFEYVASSGSLPEGSISMMTGFAWEASFVRPVTEATPFGTFLPARAVGRQDVRGRIVFYQDNATFPFPQGLQLAPNGATGRLTLYTDKARTKGYRFPAILYQLDIGADSRQDGTIVAQYAFAASCIKSDGSVDPSAKIEEL